MRRLVILSCVGLAGCVHVAHVSEKPISGVVVRQDASPVVDAQIWATFQLPGGLNAAPKTRAYGPALTGTDGTFSISLDGYGMLSTGTIFDGDTSPSIMVIHRDLGAFMVLNVEGKKEVGFQRITWPEPMKDARSRDATFRLINQLPKEVQMKAWLYLEGRKDRAQPVVPDNPVDAPRIREMSP